MFKNLLRRVAPGSETDMMEAVMDPEVTWCQVIFACNRIARLLPVADSVRAEALSFASGQRLLQFINSIQAEDGRFVKWISNLPQKFLQNTPARSLDDLRDRLMITGYVDVYQAARIILLKTLLALTITTTFHSNLNYASSEMELSRMKTAKTIHEMVNDICFSVAEVLSNLEEETWSTRNHTRRHSRSRLYMHVAIEYCP